MRFDMRVPGKSAAEIAAQYEAAIEMARWADDKGCTSIGVTEHHAADDGYMASPLMLATAMAAVTKKVPLIVGAALLPMYDPVRLAEDMTMLDHISRGRVLFILGIGYRPIEYQLYGLDYSQRGAIADAKLTRLLDVLRQASDATSMPRVTPRSFTPGRPNIAWGGGSKAAARRAGRNGLGFFAQADTPGLAETYAAAARAAGFEPGTCLLPSPEMPGAVFVHPDPDQGWREVGPYLVADAISYAEWNKDAGRPTVRLSQGRTIEELRAERAAHRVVDAAEAAEIARRWGRLPLHPLCGGIPPEIAWQYLRRVVEDVLPRLAT
ncbi:MAG TPA: LLM class flavin-dependent oxidoreductase [Steroidobacteraceae bacterium]|nr:LLM class flavin-dependent oxidoreductase [Steroidobacteraceae bacterium]